MGLAAAVERKEPAEAELAKKDGQEEPRLAAPVEGKEPTADMPNEAAEADKSAARNLPEAAQSAEKLTQTQKPGAQEARGQESRTISEGSIKWYVKGRHFCQLFLKEKEVLLLDLRELTGEERDFLDVKLSAVRSLGKGAWRAAAGILLAAITLRGGWLVAQSAVPYQGKLAWYLDDLRDKRTCPLKHDNVYEYGIEGILEDVRKKVDLPKKLCLATSFNLHFAPDGEILTLDTMLYGFDEEGNFVDSYLISYNRARSRKMTVYLHGAAGASYDERKALAPLVEAVRVMPLRETAEEWEGEQVFGLLYYGIRQWYSPEGIRWLVEDGSWQPLPYGEYTVSGYSISVFCPENDDLTPVRYLCLDFSV